MRLVWRGCSSQSSRLNDAKGGWWSTRNPQISSLCVYRVAGAEAVWLPQTVFAPQVSQIMTISRELEQISRCPKSHGYHGNIWATAFAYVNITLFWNEIPPRGILFVRTCTNKTRLHVYMIRYNLLWNRMNRNIRPITLNWKKTTWRVEEKTRFIGV